MKTRKNSHYLFSKVNVVSVPQFFDWIVSSRYCCMMTLLIRATSQRSDSARLWNNKDSGRFLEAWVYWTKRWSRDFHVSIVKPILVFGPVLFLIFLLSIPQQILTPTYPFKADKLQQISTSTYPFKADKLPFKPDKLRVVYVLANKLLSLTSVLFTRWPTSF